jgi:hypothetical protein
VAILVVTHLRKVSAADPMDEINASTGLAGGVDGFLILKRDRGRHDATLYVDGRDVEEAAELALKWDADLASWALVGNADEYRMSNERAEILAVLRPIAPQALSPKEIATLLDKSTNAVSQRLYHMLQDGQVKSPGRGLYMVDKDRKDDKERKDADSLSESAGRKDRRKDESRIGKADPRDFTNFMDFPISFPAPRTPSLITGPSLKRSTPSRVTLAVMVALDIKPRGDSWASDVATVLDVIAEESAA